MIGRHLSEIGLLPDLVLVSPSRRTLDTWDLVAPMLPERPPTRIEPRIYEAPAARLLEVVREIEGEVAMAMLVGHNPGLEELVGLLAGEGEREAVARLAGRYPTGGLAYLTFGLKHWRDIGRGKGRLERFDTPASLGEGPDS